MITLPEAFKSTGGVIKKHDKDFQKLLAKHIGRNVPASMINGIRRNGFNGISYDSREKYKYNKKKIPNTLHSHFMSVGVVPKKDGNQLTKPNSFISCKYDYSYAKAKVNHNSGKTNKKRPRNYEYQKIRCSML